MVEGEKIASKSKKPLTVRHKARQFAVLKTSCFCKKIGICMVEAKFVEPLSDRISRHFSPLPVIRFPPANLKRPVHLFNQQQANHLMGKRHLGKR